MSKSIGFIGCGNMGRALLEGLLDQEVTSPDQIWVAAKTSAQSTAQRYGIKAVTPPQVLQYAEITILGIKPQQLASASPWWRDAENATDPEQSPKTQTLISLLAGTSFAQLRDHFPSQVKLVRVMPNLPARVRCGMTLYCPEESQDQARVDKLLRDLFSPLGQVEPLKKEEDFHAATAISGCGPAYLFQVIEALADAGVHQGLTRETALRLAAYTVHGSGALAIHEHPAILKDQVTSPAGVTIAGVRVLERLGVRSAMFEAVIEAAERSRELETYVNRG